MLPTAVLAGVIGLAAADVEACERLPVSEVEIVQQIERYCAASWRNASIPGSEWSDCSQQVFVELLERVSRRQLAAAILDPKSSERRELNRSIWRIIQRWVRRVRYLALGGPSFNDPPDSTADRGDADRFARIREVAAERTTPRQARIIAMLCDGHSIREIAQVLNIPAARVSDEKYRAVQKLRRHL